MGPTILLVLHHCIILHLSFRLALYEVLFQREQSLLGQGAVVWQEALILFPGEAYRVLVTLMLTGALHQLDSFLVIT